MNSQCQSQCCCCGLCYSPAMPPHHYLSPHVHTPVLSSKRKLVAHWKWSFNLDATMPPLSHRASLRKLHQISPGAKDIGTAIMPQKTFQLCKKKILNLFFKKILVLANQYFLKFWPSFTPLKGGKPLPSQSLFEDQSLTMVKEGEGDPTHGT